MKTVAYAVVAAVLLHTVLANVFLHNPRGSNNRACETNENVNNKNRLFNSQNNDAGGYACPRNHFDSSLASQTMYYFTGSILPITWTAPQGCDTNTCQVIIQYACNDTLKSNTRDSTPATNTDAASTQATASTYNNMNVGVHESLDHYQKCKIRRRNGGLYIADQAAQNTGRLTAVTNAMGTRQNPNENEAGLECQEERDYYPYWHPSPWRDVAVFTNQPDRCPFYQQESQNVKEKGECYSSTKTYLAYNNAQDCAAQGGTWTNQASFGTSAPVCGDFSSVKTEQTTTSQVYTWNWKIPSTVNEACVIRIRYNITTGDLPWTADYTNNGVAKAYIGINPVNNWGHGTLQTPHATTQSARTFQDRSFVFAIRPRTVQDSVNIYNLNTVGKRGTYVDVFPSLEYGFSPSTLQVQRNDYVHIQWTGSDYNPSRSPNSAYGGPTYASGSRSDRHNIVQIENMKTSLPMLVSSNTLFVNSNGQPNVSIIQSLATTPASDCMNVTEIALFLGLSTDYFSVRTLDSINTHKRNCGVLNNRGVYFDAGLVQLLNIGTFNYMSTRNNYFSNRQQKGTIVVTDVATPTPSSTPSPTGRTLTPTPTATTMSSGSIIMLSLATIGVVFVYLLV